MRSAIVICITSILLVSISGWSAPAKNRKYYESRGEVVWEVQTEEKVIALTFDDGPHPEYTTQILELLEQYEAKATFFVVGNKVKLYPDVVRKVLDGGNELANHTYSHAYFGRSTNLKDEIKKTEEMIATLTPQKCHLFRPPGGIFDEKLVNIAKQEGFKVIMWSWHQDTEDWKTPGVNKIVNKVLKQPRNGDIVLFHDYIEGPSQTVEALKMILPELKKRGYRFVTVSDLLTYSKMKPVKN
jgi:polysaccharide deacetylase family sporulation protein PdaB